MTLLRHLLAALCMLAIGAEAQAFVVVADSATHAPLPNASVYDRYGATVGISNRKGVLPAISTFSYPITVRYIGFGDKTVEHPGPDTIFLQEEIPELPEVVVSSRQPKMLHILAYVRDYSEMTTYTDTVFLFREKMVDFMLPTDGKAKMRGWSTPRVLASRSYYRFTNQDGLDSVSDEGRHHFSWSDWIGLPHTVGLPVRLRGVKTASDTIFGRYSPAEIWSRTGDSVSIHVNVLADSAGRKWVPRLSSFFRDGLDFERFKVRYDYDNISGDSLSSIDLSGYSYNIESTGRGHSMFRFNRVNQPYFVATNSDVYILDKEYITVKEARQWSHRNFDNDKIDIYEPMDAPELSTDILALIGRVGSIDKEGVRLDAAPDRRLIGKLDGTRNFKIGRRALMVLKDVTGISAYKARKNFNSNWRKFIKKQ